MILITWALHSNAPACPAYSLILSCPQKAGSFCQTQTEWIYCSPILTPPSKRVKTLVPLHISQLLPAFPTPCTSSRMCLSTCPTGRELSRLDLEPCGESPQSLTFWHRPLANRFLSGQFECCFMSVRNLCAGKSSHYPQMSSCSLTNVVLKSFPVPNCL